MEGEAVKYTAEPIAFMRPQDVIVGTMVVDSVTRNLLKVTAVTKNDDEVVITLENGIKLRYTTQEIASRFIALRVVKP